LFTAIYDFTYIDEVANSASTESVIEEYCRQHNVPITDQHSSLQIDPSISAKVKLFLKNNHLEGYPRILIHAGPSGAFREWPMENWRSLVKELVEQGFDNIIQVGSSLRGSLEFVPHVVIPNVFSAVDRLTLEESIALVSDCDLLLGIDSGLLHIAASVGTPAVGIFGSTSPELRFSPDRACLCVVSKVECQGCHHRAPRLHWVTGCPFNLNCMKSITVNEVLQACVSQLTPISAENRI
jgi:ADP-heptose:LPS heptosyltransferase